MHSLGCLGQATMWQQLHVCERISQQVDMIGEKAQEKHTQH